MGARPRWREHRRRHRLSCGADSQLRCRASWLAPLCLAAALLACLLACSLFCLICVAVSRLLPCARCCVVPLLLARSAVLSTAACVWAAAQQLCGCHSADRGMCLPFYLTLGLPDGAGPTRWRQLCLGSMQRAWRVLGDVDLWCNSRKHCGFSTAGAGAGAVLLLAECARA